MKAYTDIEQSKKLAEILPIESSDHHYVRKVTDFDGNPVDGEWSHPKYGDPHSKYANYIVQNFTSYEVIPCWSLAVLLEVLPNEISTSENFVDKYQIDIRKYDGEDGITWYQIAYGNNRGLSGEWHDMINTGEKEGIIDCCYEMILKLKERNLL